MLDDVHSSRKIIRTSKILLLSSVVGSWIWLLDRAGEASLIAALQLTLSRLAMYIRNLYFVSDFVSGISTLRFA